MAIKWLSQAKIPHGGTFLGCLSRICHNSVRHWWLECLMSIVTYSYSLIQCSVLAGFCLDFNLPLLTLLSNWITVASVLRFFYLRPLTLMVTFTKHMQISIEEITECHALGMYPFCTFPFPLYMGILVRACPSPKNVCDCVWICQKLVSDWCESSEWVQ